MRGEAWVLLNSRMTVRHPPYDAPRLFIPCPALKPSSSPSHSHARTWLSVFLIPLFPCSYNPQYNPLFKAFLQCHAGAPWLTN